MQSKYKILISLLVLLSIAFFLKGESKAYPTCNVEPLSYSYRNYIGSCDFYTGCPSYTTVNSSGDCDQFARRWQTDGGNTRCGFCKYKGYSCSAVRHGSGEFAYYTNCKITALGNGGSNYNCSGTSEPTFCDAAPDGCTVNSDCPSGQQCKNPGTASSQCVDCVNNNGCSNNNTCVNNACVARYACSGTSCVKTVGGSYGGSTCGGACCPTPSCSGKCGTVTNACGNSASCGGCTNAICSNNTCVQCTSSNTSKCSAGEVCNNNTCACPPAPACGTKECGYTSNACGNTRNCGVNGTRNCPAGTDTCNANDRCVTPATYSISGNVTYNGAASSGRTVQMKPASATNYNSSDTTNANGNYSFAGLSNGTYDVRLVNPNTNLYTITSNNPKSPTINNANVTGVNFAFVDRVVATPTPECSGNNQCPTNETCVSGTCVNRYACNASNQCVLTRGGSYTGSNCGGNCVPAPTPVPTYNVNVSVFYDLNRDITWDANETNFYDGGGSNIFGVRGQGQATSSPPEARYTYNSGQWNASGLRTVTTTSQNHAVRLIDNNVAPRVLGYTFNDGSTGRTYDYSSSCVRNSGTVNGLGYSIVKFNGCTVSNPEQLMSGSTIRFALEPHFACVASTCVFNPGGPYNGSNCGGACAPAPTPTATPTPPPATYTISGTVFDDGSLDGRYQSATENPYNIAASSINSTGGTKSVTNGAYSFSGLASGSYTITLSVPANYSSTWPNGASFTITVGPTCPSVNPSPGGAGHDGACSSGNIVSLNFGITSQTKSWIQSEQGSIRFDAGLDNPVPASVNPSCSRYTITNSGSNDPGVAVSGGTISTGQAPVSSTDWKVDNAPYTPATPSTVRTSYNYILSNLKQQGRSPTDLASKCSGGLSNCTLTGMTTGVYQANGPLTITGAYTNPVNTNVVILVNGDLRISNEIHVPQNAGSTLLMSAKGNIKISPNFGASLISDPTSHVEGIFSADGNFTIESSANCSLPGGGDKRLNMEGAVITNADLRGVGSFQNNRDMCVYTCPSFSIKQRLDFLIYLPTLLRVKPYVYREIAP